jgi:hypothetical protein
MRVVLVVGLLIAWCASADAATVHRAKPPERHSHQGQPVTAPGGFAVPGWTDQQTRSWLNDATGPRD